jgi:hypothetical protein
MDNQSASRIGPARRVRQRCALTWHRSSSSNASNKLCPIMPWINPDYASAAPAQMVQHRLGTSRRTPRRCSPVASVRRRSCSHQPETLDAVLIADLAFDQPLEGVPRSPGRRAPASPDARAGIAARETEYTPIPEGRTVNTCHGRHTTDRAEHGAWHRRNSRPMCTSSPLCCTL